MIDHGQGQGPERINSHMLGFVLGAAVGAGMALLFAPASGTETRRRLGETSRRLTTRVKDGLHDAQGKLTGLKDDVEAAVHSGTDAFKRERDSRRSDAHSSPTQM